MIPKCPSNSTSYFNLFRSCVLVSECEAPNDVRSASVLCALFLAEILRCFVELDEQSGQGGDDSVHFVLRCSPIIEIRARNTEFRN